VFAELSVREFLSKVGSGEPVPGGGSVAALAVGFSASLTRMVAQLTRGRKADAALDEKMGFLIEKSSQLEARLLSAIDEDSAAYARVMDAYRLPNASDDEKKIRQHAIQDALKGAALVPLSVAEMGVELLLLAEIAVKEGNKNAATDGLVGALMARSGVLGALYNVRINLVSITDDAFSSELKAKVARLEGQTLEKESEIIAFASRMMEKGT
jgi:methenyltetrahydrofolate cyclohydrolase